jgi:hypothetical protein
LRLTSGASVAATELPEEPERLLAYADQETAKDSRLGAENALIAVDKILASDPKSHEALWRGARACAWLAQEVTDGPHREAYSQRGMDYAKRAVEAEPKRVEGYYYLGINIGLYATTKTFGRSLVPKVRDAAQEAVKADESYDHAGPLRLLGSVFVKAPPWPASIGDVDEGQKHLSRAVQIARDYPENHLLFGDALASDDHPSDAIREYKLVLSAPSQPEWAHRLERWKREAKEGIKKLTKKSESASTGGGPF